MGNITDINGNLLPTPQSIDQKYLAAILMELQDARIARTNEINGLPFRGPVSLKDFEPSKPIPGQPIAGKNAGQPRKQTGP